jgi:hypothetical protein
LEEEKVEKVKDWQPLRNVREVCCFLSFIGYYRHFIKGYLAVAKPLLELTKKATVWRWGREEQEAFKGLRDRMCKKPILWHPDPKKTFYLQTDASAYGAGAVLSQDEDESGRRSKRHPIAFYSATFTPTEQNYDVYEREFLAVKKAIEHWRAYLIWTEKPFIIEMDHENLMYWKNPKKLTGRTV